MFDIEAELKKLPRKYLNKLFTDNDQYRELRNDLFSGGDNLKKIREEYDLF